MKSVKKNAYDLNTWQQLSSKIRNAEAEKQSYNQSFMQKLKSSSGSSTTQKSK